jgi:hypothetical protein
VVSVNKKKGAKKFRLKNYPLDQRPSHEIEEIAFSPQGGTGRKNK